MTRYIITTTLLFFIFSSTAQQLQDSELDKLSLTYAKASFNELVELLSLPNDAHYPKDIEKNIKWCEKAFKDRGFTSKRLITEKIPLLLAGREHKGAKKTVLIYLQVDGQPVDTTKWFQENPYKAVLKEQDNVGKWNTIPLDKLTAKINPDWRIFARSTSDAKGPVVMFLKAMDIINDFEYEPNYNIKVITPLQPQKYNINFNSRK